MATISRFEDLEVWKKARAFAHEIFLAYTQSEAFARDFKLRDQINGASGSIMDNIAEGFERNGKKEFVQFLSIAKASVGEVKSQLYRAYDRNYLEKDLFDRLCSMADELAKNLGGFIIYLNKSIFQGTKFKRDTVSNSKS